MDDDDERTTAILNTSWDENLSQNLKDNIQSSQDARCLATFSLSCYLNITIYELLIFIFSTKIKRVQQGARQFMSFRKRSEGNIYGPRDIWDLWMSRARKDSRSRLKREIIHPTAFDIGRAEVTAALKMQKFKVDITKLSLVQVRKMLDPASLTEMLCTALPFCFGFLTHLSTTPNREQIRKINKRARRTSELEVDDEMDLDDDESGSEGSLDQETGEMHRRRREQGSESKRRNPNLVSALSTFKFVKSLIW